MKNLHLSFLFPAIGITLLLTGCMLLMGVKDQMHKIDRSTLRMGFAGGLEHRLHPYAAHRARLAE